MEDLEGVEHQCLEGIGGDEAVVRAQDAALVVTPRLHQNHSALEQVRAPDLAVHLQPGVMAILSCLSVCPDTRSTPAPDENNRFLNERDGESQFRARSEKKSHEPMFQTMQVETCTELGRYHGRH